MLTLDQAPSFVLVLFSIWVVFIGFVFFTMTYLRYYFNQHEPVYIRTKAGACEKNHIASRFCKIILSNTITDQCLTDIDNIGLWITVSGLIAELPCDEILCLNDMHRKISDKLYDTLDERQYEKIKVNMIHLELAIGSNLMKSKIRTPPYLKPDTYALWINRVVCTLNKS